jgi:elongation factor P
MANTKVNQIKRKNVIRYNGDPCIVNECTIRTPPNLTSFCQMTLRNLISGKVVHVRCPVSDSYDVLNSDNRRVEYSYENQGVLAFMDDETFEMFEMNQDGLKDEMPYLAPNQHYDLLMIDGNPLTINLPAVVELKVTEAADALRGDTSGNAQKPVTVETGLVVNVPLFIKTGDVIRVKTDDGSYQGRV